MQNGLDNLRNLTRIFAQFSLFKEQLIMGGGRRLSSLKLKKSFCTLKKNKIILPRFRSFLFLCFFYQILIIGELMMRRDF